MRNRIPYLFCLGLQPAAHTPATGNKAAILALVAAVTALSLVVVLVINLFQS